MSGIRDVIARMATDAAFAEHVRSHPEEVAQQYGLSAEELTKVRGLAATEPGTGPSALGPRLSKSGIGAGGMVSLLASIGELPEQVPAEQEQGPTPPGALFVFNPQPEPPEPILMPEGPPQSDDVVPAADQVLSMPGEDVGYYPWPNAPGDPFAGVPDTEAAAHTTGLGAPVPGEEDGIIIVNSGVAAPGDEEGIIIINSMPAPDLGPAPDDSAPPADDGGPAPEARSPEADGAGEMIIDDGDSQAQPAPPKIVTGLKLPDSSSPLGSQEPYVTY